MIRKFAWTAALTLAPLSLAFAVGSGRALHDELMRDAAADGLSVGAPFAKAGPGASDVGDADSFGRNLKWLGLMQGNIDLVPDCTGVASDPSSRCVTLSPPPAITTFAENDLAHVTLPARAANSLVCQWVTPYLYYNLFNPTASDGNAQFRATPSVTVESTVLNDPSLINPDTGLSFGGSFTIGLTGAYTSAHTLAPGAHDQERINFSRVCIAGILNRNLLTTGYGLSSAQVDTFFRSPVTLRLNIAGSAAYVQSASLIYGVRLIGD